MSYQSRQDGNPTPLANFLSIYDILILITEELHYTDIVHLTQVSKSVREAIIPTTDYAQRLAHFRLYTCSPTTKTQCWLCENQICANCKHERFLKQLPLYWHLDTCRPYCNKCYFGKIQHARPSQRQTPPHCRCKPATMKPNFLYRWWKGDAYFRDQQLAFITRLVCSDCNYMTDEDLLSRREESTRLELKDPGRRGMERCTVCEERLGRGPRWWVCGRESCGKECRDFCHAPWGKEKKGEREERGKVGVVVGEQTV